MTAPLVSVVTPFLDAVRFLGEAVDSVRAQTEPRWELLLVDDGSRDGSECLARDLAAQDGRIRYLAHPGGGNRGKSTSRNLGLAAARGAYVTFLDADDVFLPDKLARQVALLEAHPEAGMVHGRTLYWHGWERGAAAADVPSKLAVAPDALYRPPTPLTAFLRDPGSVPCICSVLVRRALVEAVGGFDETIQHLFEDQVLLAKLCLAAPVWVEDAVGERYRQHAGSSSARAVAAGIYHPLAPNPAHDAFLAWLNAYVAAQGVADPELARALRRAAWPSRHPSLHRHWQAAAARARRVRRWWRALRGRIPAAPAGAA